MPQFWLTRRIARARRRGTRLERRMLTAKENKAVSVAALARESYRDIALYSAPRGPFSVDLSDNTNLWGAPPGALRALAAVTQEDVTRYPVAYEPALATALADYVGVSA